MNNALILYPHQLFPLDKLPEVSTVFIVEEPLLFGADSTNPLKLHKQKLILLRAATQRYVTEVLWPANLKVEYIDLDVLYQTGDVLNRAKKFEQLFVFDPVDVTISTRLLEARRNRDDLPPIEFLPNPNFYLADVELRDYFSKRHAHPFDEFYQWQRERFNVLIGEDYKPIGGAWELKTDKAQSSKNQLPSFGVFGDNDFAKQAVQWVNERFSDNPGSTDFIWPTSHTEAETWLHDFVANRLPGFASNYHRLDGDAAWLYHSALSSSLNIGLLSPEQVIDAVVEQFQKNPDLLQDVELVVRLVLGEREYARGLYLAKQDEIVQDKLTNVRRLSAAWYQGQLGIPPYDDVIKKVINKGYAHGAERALVIGGLMIMCDINRTDIINFFRQMFVDAFDWSILPALYRLEQLLSEDFSDIPSVNPSSYIIELGGYERGVWSDVWDGLFWRFVEAHQAVLAKQSHMRSNVQSISSLDTDHKRIISYRADDFLKQYTN